MTITTISEGIRLIATATTTRKYFKECEALKRASERARATTRKQDSLRAWLADPANYDDELYSDIYKDVYGVRPR